MSHGNHVGGKRIIPVRIILFPKLGKLIPKQFGRLNDRVGTGIGENEELIFLRNIGLRQEIRNDIPPDRGYRDQTVTQYNRNSVFIVRLKQIDAGVLGALSRIEKPRQSSHNLITSREQNFQRGRKISRKWQPGSAHLNRLCLRRIVNRQLNCFPVFRLLNPGNSQCDRNMHSLEGEKLQLFGTLFGLLANTYESSSISCPTSLLDSFAPERVCRNSPIKESGFVIGIFTQDNMICLPVAVEVIRRSPEAPWIFGPKIGKTGQGTIVQIDKNVSTMIVYAEMTGSNILPGNDR